MSLRTDLALEAHAAHPTKPVPGVNIHEEHLDEGIVLTRVHVEDERGSRALSKAPGHYVTLESARLRHHDREHAVLVGKALSREIERQLERFAPQSVLVVGLGNWNATPDSLGPEVVERILVTRHIRDLVDEEVRKELKTVAALAPGVLGSTGMETTEIVQGVVEHIRPDLVVAIDALAASSIERIASTVQLSDTGIQPGSGVGNHRHSMTEETLGVPVMAIGVPTVVHAETIARETLEALIKHFPSIRLGDEDWKTERTETFSELMVTPKEIDAQIGDLSRLISGALNTAFHADIDLGEFALYA